MNRELYINRRMNLQPETGWSLQVFDPFASVIGEKYFVSPPWVLGTVAILDDGKDTEHLGISYVTRKEPRLSGRRKPLWRLTPWLDNLLARGVADLWSSSIHIRSFQANGMPTCRGHQVGPRS